MSIPGYGAAFAAFLSHTFGVVNDERTCTR